MDENTLLVYTADGQEKKMDIVFTFDLETYGKQYVCFTDPENEELGCYVMSYNDQGELFAIEDDAEWDMCAEVVDGYNSQFEEETQD